MEEIIIKKCTRSTPVDASFETRKFNAPHEVIINESVINNGRVMSVKKVITERPSDKIKDYKWQDFTIENLTAIGAVDMLKLQRYNDVDVDNVVNQLEDLDNKIGQVNNMDNNVVSETTE